MVDSLREWATADDVFVFFDTKGDYYTRFYRDGDAVIAGVPGEFEGEVSWNMFAELKATAAGRDPEDELFEMCSGLFTDMIRDGGDNVFFVKAARDTFVALVTALYREDGDRDNSDFRLRIAAMTQPEMLELLDREGNEDLAVAKKFIHKESANVTAATLAYMQQAVNDSFRSAFGKPGSFSIRAFLREKGGTALFFEYDVAAGSLLSSVYKTLLDIGLKEAMSRRRADGRVFFILDEFALLPELTHLANALNFGRSLGVRIIAGVQDTNQVETMYGDAQAKTVLAAFGNVISFRLYGETSRAFVTSRYGKARKIVKRIFDTRSGHVDGRVIEDWDISELTTGSCIAALADHAPVRFTFAPPLAEDDVQVTPTTAGS